MAERQQQLRQAPEYQKSELTISDRLVLSYQARQNFQEAIDIAAQTNGGDVMNALVEVGSKMVETGLSPEPVLARLTQGRDNLPEVDRWGSRRDREFIELGMADVHGMLGEHDSMRALLRPPEQDGVLWTVSPYLYAGRQLIRSSQNPTPILEEAMGRVEKSKAHYDNYFGKTSELIRIAKVFYEAGLDPKIAFSRAEAIIEAARRINTRTFFDYRTYEELGEGYAQCGLAEDAIRIVELLREVTDGHNRDWVTGQTIGKITKAHLARGEYDAALEVAKKYNLDRFTAGILSKKAVAQAREGTDPSATVTEALTAVGDKKCPQVYEEVYPQLALALHYSGKADEAKRMLEGIRAAMDGFDLEWDKADVGRALAKAMDEMGFDSEDLYQEILVWDEITAKELGGMFGKSDEKIVVGEEVITDLIQKGNFQQAKRYIDDYDIKYAWQRSGLLADLANEQARRGLSPQEIETLSPEDIRTILASDNETAKQALTYFGRV